MKKLLLCSSVFLLAACGNKATTSISEELKNPLTASQYGDELADALADLFIQNDPLLEEEGMKDKVNAEIEKAKETARLGKERMGEGRRGAFIPMDNDMSGHALLLDGTLYLSPAFMTDPGPNLHLYLSTTVDPRDGEFPDASAIDLGVIQTPYGAQEYAVSLKEEAEKYRTVALWDTSLGRLYGFAQLSGF